MTNVVNLGEGEYPVAFDSCECLKRLIDGGLLLERYRESDLPLGSISGRRWLANDPVKAGVFLCRAEIDHFLSGSVFATARPVGWPLAYCPMCAAPISIATRKISS